MDDKAEAEPKPLLAKYYHALTLKLPIQTSHSVAPKLLVSARSGEKCGKFSKTSTPQVLRSHSVVEHCSPFLINFFLTSCGFFSDDLFLLSNSTMLI